MNLWIGVLPEFSRFFESLAVCRSRLSSIGGMLASWSKLFMGVDQKAPSASLMAAL